MTKGRGKIKDLYEDAVQGSTGIFVNVETEKFQTNFFKHIQLQKFLKVEYLDTRAGKIDFNAQITLVKPNYDIKLIESNVVDLDQNDVPSVRFQLPRIILGPGEVLAALPIRSTTLGAVPLTTPEKNGYSTLSLIEIPCQGICEGQYGLRDERLTKDVSEIALYATSDENQPRLLTKIKVRLSFGSQSRP